MGGATAQRQAGEHEGEADQRHGHHVEAGARELALGGGGLRRARRRLRRRLRGGHLLMGRRLDHRGLRLGLGLGLRLAREGVGVLLVARPVLREGAGGGEGDREAHGHSGDATWGRHAGRCYRRAAP